MMKAFMNERNYKSYYIRSWTHENLTFDVDNVTTHNSFDALFGKELPEISAKYFGKCVHYAQKFTRTLKQLPLWLPRLELQVRF